MSNINEYLPGLILVYLTYLTFAKQLLLFVCCLRWQADGHFILDKHKNTEAQ